MKKTVKKKSSQIWINRNINDQYRINAQKNGYRARSFYKIEQIDIKYGLISPEMRILDLGCAPGAWLQYFSSKISNPKGCIIGIDLLSINPIKNVRFFQKNFLEKDTQEIILKLVPDKFDGIVSDMACNTTGLKFLDHLKTMELVEEAFKFSLKNIRKNGFFLTKYFQGVNEKEFISKVKEKYKEVFIFKPDSSRAESSEKYLLARTLLD